MRRRLIPNPFDTEEQQARFAHRDLAQLSMAQLWAELTANEAALAARIARRIRPRIVMAWPAVVTDTAWLLDRIRHLRHEHRRRGLHVR
jgi:hypothetical protein